MRKVLPTILAAVAATLAIVLLVMLIQERTGEREVSEFSAVQYTLDNLEKMDIDTSNL